MNGFEEIRCLDAPLADKLAAYASQLSNTNPGTATSYSLLIDRLRAGDAGSQAPQTGSILPPFLLPDNKGCLASSAELLGSGPLVVSFNRGHWCKFCQLELAALAEIYSEIKRLGGEIVSIMPDNAAPVECLRKDLDIPFRILSDIDNGYALSCGLMVALGSAVREVYLKIGRDLSEFHGNAAWFVPIPATFVIRTDGYITGRLVDPDFRHRMAPEDILECLKKLS